MRINGSDPMVYNEIGVVFYRQNNFEQAKEYLEWLSSRKSQLEQTAHGRDLSKADVIKSLLDEIQEESSAKEDDYNEVKRYSVF